MSQSCLLACRSAALLCCLVATSFAFAVEPYFSGLGDFPGAGYRSRANGVSADGSVVVGWGTSAATTSPNPFEAFRWTPGTGLQALGDLGATVASVATAVSGDGQAVVGLSESQNRAFRWTAQDGMIDLGIVSPADSGQTISAAL